MRKLEIKYKQNSFTFLGNYIILKHIIIKLILMSGKYYHYTKKDDFIKLKLRELQEDEIFLSLDIKSQNEIINNIKSYNHYFIPIFPISKIIVFSLIWSLFLFLIINFFFDFINIPLYIHTLFFALTLWLTLIVFLDEKKERIKRVKIMYDSWEELPLYAKKDFLIIIKNEIEINKMNFLFDIIFTKKIIIFIYIILLFLSINVLINERDLTMRFFTILYLDLLIIFILQNKIYTFDTIYIWDSCKDIGFLKSIMNIIKINYNVLLFVIVFYFILTLIYILKFLF